MQFRDRPLLVDGIDRDLYVGRPDLEASLLSAVRGSRNVLLIGPRGAGKSTALHKLRADLNLSGQHSVIVSAGAANGAEELLALIASELRLPEPEPEPAMATPVVTLVRRVRALGAATPSVILIDDPLEAETAFELFGRLREELWGLPHRWVLAIRSEQSATVRRPPADAFFSEVIDVPPFSAAEIRNLLEKGLDTDEATRMLNATALPLMDYPRDVIRFVRQVLDGTRPKVEGAAQRREELARGLGRSASMVLAEVEGLDEPVSAGDSRLLDRMGWTRPHAARTLARMEAAGILRSFLDGGTERPGRPRKLYEANPEPPT